MNTILEQDYETTLKNKIQESYTSHESLIYG